ncbi:hypothetical protein ACLIBH_07435 [Virgibacillus sp. W0430]|uniref:hypothetical protein n=1 Tax=Virgibacillus sp. W0430 TaxID=3391580 RepID=UPI003F4679CE
MSKEMLKQADEWLRSMYDLLSLKTDPEDIEYTQKRIDLFKWMIEQAERVQELGNNLDHGAKVAVETARRLHKEQEQNKRYWGAIESMRLHAHYPKQIKQIYEALESESD